LNQASISWLDLPRPRALPAGPAGGRGGRRDPNHGAHEYLAWVGTYRGDPALAAEHASASGQWARRTAAPAIRADSLSTFVMVEFLSSRVEPVRRPPAARQATTPA
jgi:hypothetical protein